MKQTLVSIVIPFQYLEGDSARLWGQIRSENGPLNGLWEFPGGKLESGEFPRDCAQRELREETGLDIPLESIQPFKTYPFTYNDRKVVLYTHLLSFSPQSEYLEVLSKQGWKDFTFQSLEEFKGVIPEANEGILEDLGIYFFENRLDKDWREMWQRFSC